MRISKTKMMINKINKNNQNRFRLIKTDLQRNKNLIKKNRLKIKYRIVKRNKAKIKNKFEKE
jgi:hypothetical protein